MNDIDTQTLREQVAELKNRLARMQAMLDQRDQESWQQYQRERAEAIRQADKIAARL